MNPVYYLTVYCIINLKCNNKKEGNYPFETTKNVKLTRLLN